MKAFRNRNLAGLFTVFFVFLSLPSLRGEIDWAFITVGEGDSISGTVRTEGDPVDLEGTGIASFTVTDLLSMRVNGADISGDFSTALVRSNQVIQWDREAQSADYENLSAVIFDFEAGGIGLQVGSGRDRGGPNSFTRGSVSPYVSFKSAFTGYLPLVDAAGGFPVVFEAEYGGSFDGGGPVFQLILQGEAAVPPLVVADPDFNFLGWDRSFDAITEDTVITAEFEVVPEIRDNPLKLFVADQLNGRIVSYDLATGTLEGIYGIANQDDSSLTTPNSLTIHDELLYVVSGNSNEVIVYDRSRVASAIAARPTVGWGLFDDIAISANGEIFVAQSPDGIAHYDQQGQLLGILAGSEPESLHPDGVGSTGGLLFGPHGRLFAVVSDNQDVEDRIITFSADGTFEGTFGEAVTGSSPISNPRDLAFDSSGNLLVVDSPGVLKYDSEGNYLETLLPSVYAFSITLDSEGNIYLGDSDEVMKYSPSGNILETIIPQDYGLRNAVGLAIGELRNFQADNQVVVSNLSVTQLPGTKTMEIRYDVASTESAEVTVTLEVSNGGTAVSAPSVSGDVGSGIAIGTGKTILWDMAADWDGNVATLDFTVLADDGVPVVPEGMVLVEGGTLAMSMGTVGVDTFYIGQHEATWGEWQTVRTWAASNGYDIGSVGAGCADDHPVHSVNWYDVLKWCNAKSEMEGLMPIYTYDGSIYRSGEPMHASISQDLSANGYRLPQEAEWEFAARGGNQTNGTTYAGSNDINAVGWYSDNSGGAACDLYQGRGTWPVGQKAVNELGLSDMSGNVWEWCWDQYDELYRHVRGGSWFIDTNFCAVSFRGINTPDGRGSDRGFRLARSSGNYTLSFNSAGGSVVFPITQPVGSSVTAPADPTRTGYTFSGWDEAIPETMPAENKTLTAQWTANQYEVTLDPSGGSVDPASKTVTFDAPYGSLPTPVREGYRFTGWWKVVSAGEDSEVTSATTVSTAADHTLSAGWATLYTLTVNMGDGGGQYIEGETVSILAQDTAVGEQFAHWTVEPAEYADGLANADAASTSFTMPAADAALTAVYLPTFRITTTVTEGAGTISPMNPDVMQGEDQTFTITPSVGYNIGSLIVDGTTLAPSTSYPYENVQSPGTIEVVFTKKVYDVNFVLAGGNWSGGGALQQVVEHGAAALAPFVLPQAGYAFTGWSRSLNNITSDVTITAQYRQDSNEWHWVTFDLGAYGTRVGGGELRQQVRHAQPAVEPIVEVAEGWRFRNENFKWSASVEAVLDNLLVEAIYDRDPAYAELTVISEYGAPSISGSEMIPVGNAVEVTMPELTIEPATERHTCTGWSASDGSSGTGAAASLTMTEDLTLTWHWESEYYLEVTETGPGSVDIASGFYTDGTVVQLTATPDAGKEFQGWSGAATGLTKTINLTMDAAKSVTASFGAHTAEARVDSISPARSVLNTPIAFEGSAWATGGASIEQYRWRMIELVDGIEAEPFIELSSQATFINASLPAGHWRVYFDALDSTGLWADPVTEELRIENPANLTDLALSRADLRFFAEDGSELDPMMANQVRFDDQIRVEITVRNLGGTDVDAPVALSLYDGKGPESLAAYSGVSGLLGTATVDSIPAGGAAIATIDWHVGYDLAGNVLADYDGSFRLITAVAEYTANQSEARDGDTEELPVYEADPHNNKAQASILIGAVPLEDYEMVATLNNASVEEGQLVFLTGSARYRWLDNEGEVVGALVQVLVDGQTVSGTTDANGNFRVSAGYLNPGSYSIEVELSDSTLIAGAAATLTVNAKVIPPDPLADLQVQDVWVAGGPGSYETESTMPHVLLNGEVNFAARITNRGNKDASDPFNVSFTVVETGEVIGTVRVDVPLARNQSMVVPYAGQDPLPLWSSDTVGQYTIRAEVDSGSEIAEWTENNNTRSKVISVHEGSPDLRPYFISGVVVPSLRISPSDPVQGDTLTFGVDVYNAGPVDLAPTIFTVKFFIDGEVIEWQPDEPIAIAQQGYVPVEVTWDTAEVPAGYKNLQVVVDANDDVAEDFENNNSTEATFELALAQPKLVIVQTPSEAQWYAQETSLYVGETLNLPVTVKNIGGVAYEVGSVLRLSEDTLSNEQFNSDVSDPYPQPVPAMGVDRSRDMRISWQAPDTAGLVTLLLHVDGSVVSKGVRLYERTEPLPPLPPYADPAISVGDIQLVGSDWQRGELVQAEATVRNRGTEATGDFIVEFAYSVDSVGYTPLGLSQTVPALAVGESFTLQSLGRLEAVEPYYTIRVRITSTDAGNRGYNDAATRSFAIAAPWADAGSDQIAVISRTVALDGSASRSAGPGKPLFYAWEFSSTPLGSTAELTGADTATPSFVPDVAGSYEIQLQVSDDTQYSPYDWVNILVNEQVGTVLTVASVYGTPSPAAGTHPLTIGSQLSISAADVVTGGVKRVSTGWSGTGIDPASGTTTPATITIIDELPSLSWEWETQYLFELTSVGDGSVTGDSGWLPAGGEATLEALPGEGYDFFKWEGDLAGSSQNGSTINLPVDQARSIEAHFRPAPVANFTAQVTSLETVQLSWTYNGLAEAAFRVERMLGGESHWETLATVSIPAFVDYTVAEGQSMFYRVFAVHGGLDSTSADTQIEVPYLPDVPAALGADSVSSAEVLVIWQPAARADGYVVQRRHLPLGEWETLTTLGAVSTWSDHSVAAGERYAYRVRAYNASGNSGFSRTADAVLPPDTGDWTFGLQVDNVVASSNMLSGAEVSAVMDVLLSNPSGDLTQHRVVAGLRDAEGVAVETPLELAELSGVPSYPPEWRTEISLPDGLRLPSEAGVYTLWVESVLGGEDPREAFADTMRTNETGMAKRIAEFTAVLPESGDAFVALAESSGLAGEFIDLPITVGAISGENAFSFSLLYDPSALEFEGLTPLGAMEGSYLQVNDRTLGAVGAIMLLPLGIGLEAGVQDLATARFRIREGADGPVAVSFGDSPSFRLVSDAFANLLPHVWYDGQVSVSNVSYEADVSPRGNPNGEVNASDRIQIMRFVVGLEEPSHGSEFQRADCAPIATLGDGQINLLDAVIATRYAGGTEPLKKAGGPTEPQQVFSQLSTMRSLESNSNKSSLNGDAAVIRLQADTAERGDLLEVPVSIQSGGNVEAASFSLSFDPNELVFLDAEPAAILSGALTALNRETATNGSLSYVFRLLEGNSLSSGEVPVLTLRFRVSEAASDATTTIAITSDPAPLMLSDGNGSEIPVTAQNTNVYLQTIDADGAPAAVNDLTASLEGDQRVRLTWTDVPTESGYAVYRRSSLEEWNLLVELAEDTVSYLDEGLAQGVAYSYRIGAVNIDGESSSDIALVDIPSPYRQWVNNRIAQDAEGLPEADEDNDGLWNYLEFLTGRNPTQPDGNIFQIGREDIYGLGEDYLTLSFEALSDVSMDSIVVETSHDLTSGSWQPATKVEDVEADNVRRLKYRSSSPMADEPRQFMRLRSQQ